MSRLGDKFVRGCKRLNRIPAAILCVVVFILQAAVIDYYLVHHMGSKQLAWMVGDIVICALLIVSIILSIRTLERQKMDENAGTKSIAWITWFFMHSILAAKVIVIFMNFSVELDEEETFFGPNTLKTTIALGSIVFLLLLTTQHDAPQASERKKYIEDLTGTVFFDLLDTTDILEILFDEEDRNLISEGMEIVVLGVATLNLILPTVPLVTLSKTKFGHTRLRQRMVYLHKVLIILAVNVPNLMVRLVLWHGFSVGISPFTLKNFILIVMTLYEFYEHKLEKYEEHEREREMETFEPKDPTSNGVPHISNGFDAGDNTDDGSYVDVRDGHPYCGRSEVPTRRSTSSRDFGNPTETTL